MWLLEEVHLMLTWDVCDGLSLLSLSVGEGIMFLGCPVVLYIHSSPHLFVCLFFRSDIVTTVSHERLEQL